MDDDALLGVLALSLLSFFWASGVVFRVRRVEFWRPIEALARRRSSSEVDGKELSGSGVGLGGRLFGRRRRRRITRVTDEALAAMCMEVAGRLETGADVSSAWRDTWERRFPGTAEQTPEGLPLELVAQRGTAVEMVVAAARFSALTGAPLAEVMRGTGRSLGLLEEGAAAQRTAFAGPRLSARILAALPLVGLLAGEILGARPLAWFASGLLPAAVGGVGLLLGLGGVWVSRRMIATARGSAKGLLVSPLICDLTASGLRGGAAIPGTLKHLGAALDDGDYARIGQELLLGATWAEAWTPVPVGGALLADALQPGWEDGVAPVELLEHAADDARRRASSAAQTAAQELSVKLAVPLAGLLLPAFVLLGLVPIFFALVTAQLG